MRFFLPKFFSCNYLFFENFLEQKYWRNPEERTSPMSGKCYDFSRFQTHFLRQNYKIRDGFFLESLNWPFACCRRINIQIFNGKLIDCLRNLVARTSSKKHVGKNFFHFSTEWFRENNRVYSFHQRCSWQPCFGGSSVQIYKKVAVLVDQMYKVLMSLSLTIKKLSRTPERPAVFRPSSSGLTIFFWEGWQRINLVFFSFYCNQNHANKTTVCLVIFLKIWNIFCPIPLIIFFDSKCSVNSCFENVFFLLKKGLSYSKWKPVSIRRQKSQTILVIRQPNILHNTKVNFQRG